MRVEDLGRLHEYVGARVASLASSLKFRLAVASVAALAAGIGITSAVLATRTETDTLVAQYKLEAHEAERTARQLGMRLRHQQAALAAAAGQLEPAWFDDPPRLLEYLRTKPVLLAQFDSVFIAGANGAMRLIHDDKGFRQQQVQLADRDYFRMALSEGRAVVSDLIVGRVAAIPVIVLAQPVKGHVGNAGVIGGALRITSRDLLASVADASTDEHGELVVVADARGRIVAHPDAKMIGQPLASEPRLAVALERRRAAQAGTAAGAAVGTAAGTAVVLADERIVAIGQVPGASWTVWRSRLRADVLAPLTAGRTLAMRWAAGLVVVLAIGVVALLWWLLQPLSRLQRRAEHLFDGSSDAQAGWPEAGGEIGQLERVLRHVSAERSQLEAFNSRVIQRLESVMAAAPIGIAFTASKRFEMVSRQFCQLLGRDESALLGQPAQLIYGSSDDYARVGLKAGAAFAAGQAYDGEWSLLRGDGQRFWARLRGQPVDWGRADAGTIWTVHDITHEVSSRHALEWAATHDALTGLANRKAFEQALGQVFAALPHSMPASLVAFDLDSFKPINDQHGHAAGDAMLRAVAAAAAACARSGDLLVRLGGDEFALLIERCPADSARRVAEELHSAVTALRLPWEGQLLQVGVSVGVAPLTAELADGAAWLQAADRACYAAKAAGRGRVVASAEAASVPRQLAELPA